MKITELLSDLREDDQMFAAIPGAGPFGSHAHPRNIETTSAITRLQGYYRPDGYRGSQQERYDRNLMKNSGMDPFALGFSSQDELNRWADSGKEHPEIQARDYSRYLASGLSRDEWKAQHPDYSAGFPESLISSKTRMPTHDAMYDQMAKEPVQQLTSPGGMLPSWEGTHTDVLPQLQQQPGQQPSMPSPQQPPAQAAGQVARPSAPSTPVPQPQTAAAPGTFSGTPSPAQQATVPGQMPGLRRGGTAQGYTLQQQLNARGANLATDGIIGPLTRGATRNFQTQNELTADGIAGRNTLGALQQNQPPTTSTPSQAARPPATPSQATPLPQVPHYTLDTPTAPQPAATPINAPPTQTTTEAKRPRQSWRMTWQDFVVLQESRG